MLCFPFWSFKGRLVPPTPSGYLSHGCGKPNRCLYIPDTPGFLPDLPVGPQRNLHIDLTAPIVVSRTSLLLMPDLTAANNNDSPVRVVVTPSQSSYFAGEPFSVTITFTNIRSPEAGPSKPSPLTHKRGAHSVSSAPLARPPTSPGTPRSANTQSLLKAQAHTDLPRRKGLIGKKKQPPLGELPDLIEQRRKRQLAPKALSVSLSPHELENEIGEGIIVSSARYTQRPSFRDSELY